MNSGNSLKYFWSYLRIHRSKQHKSVWLLLKFGLVVFILSLFQVSKKLCTVEALIYGLHRCNFFCPLIGIWPTLFYIQGHSYSNVVINFKIPYLTLFWDCYWTEGQVIVWRFQSPTLAQEWRKQCLWNKEK